MVEHLQKTNLICSYIFIYIYICMNNNNNKISTITLNLIETFKLTFEMTVYNTKHTNNTKTHFQHSDFLNNPHFRKLDIHSNQRFPLVFMARLETIFQQFPLILFLTAFRHYETAAINSKVQQLPKDAHNICYQTADF